MIALKTVADMPSATSYSPLSFGLVKLFSKDDPNILGKAEDILISKCTTCKI